MFRIQSRGEAVAVEASPLPLTGAVAFETGRSATNYWTDLWRFRELFQVLAWRDISVRYKQTVIGIIWVLLRPFLTMVIFTVIFGRIARLPTEGAAPYAIMVFAGMLPWTFFSTALGGAINSVMGNANLIGKIYFPRIIVPTAAVVVSFVDFMVNLIILAGLMVWYHFMPGWRIAVLPLFILLTFLASLGPGLWFTALNVKYRDFGYIIPFVLQMGMYISPVAFSSSVVPEQWRLLYSLNPLVGIIDGFRWSILGSSINTPELAGSVATTFLLLWVGIQQFRKTEKNFADLL